MNSGHRIRIRSVCLLNLKLPSNQTARSCFVSFHVHEVESGSLGSLIDVTDSFFLSPTGEGLLVVDIVLKTVSFICVIHELGMNLPIGLAYFSVDPRLSTSTATAGIETDIPMFSQPTIELSIICCPRIRVQLDIFAIPVGNIRLYGGVVPKLADEYHIDLRVVRGVRQECSARSPALLSETALNVLVVKYTGYLEISYNHDPSRKYQLELWISSGSWSHLVDTVVLNEQMFGEHVIVGSGACRVKAFTDGMQEDFKFKDPYGQYRMYLGNDVTVCKKRLATVYLTNVDAKSVKHISYGIVKIGNEDLCLLNESFKEVIHMKNTNVSISTSTYLESSNAIELTPVLGVLCRDVSHRLQYSCTVPLVHKAVYVYPSIGEGLEVRVELSDLPAKEECECVVPRLIAPVVSIKEGAIARLYLRVVKAVNLSWPMTGFEPHDSTVFVMATTVRSNICPSLLSISEVHSLRRLQSAKFYEAADTVRRHNTHTPVFECDLVVDSPLWSNESWLWFVIYGCDGGRANQPQSATVALAHCCVSIPLAFSASDSLTLPLVSPIIGGSPHLSSFLHLNFPKRPMQWGPMRIFQVHPTEPIPIEDSKNLCVKVYRNQSDWAHDAGERLIGKAQTWLPLKDITPMYIRSCPPSGYVILRLLSVSSVVLAQTHREYGTHGLDGIKCGGFEFRLTLCNS